MLVVSLVVSLVLITIYLLCKLYGDLDTKIESDSEITEH